MGDTLLMGDINAHIAKNTPDYIHGDVIDGQFDLISQEQIGFLKGFSTTDHSFIINSTVNKLVKGKPYT